MRIITILTIVFWSITNLLANDTLNVSGLTQPYYKQAKTPWTQSESPISYNINGILNFVSPGLSFGLEKRLKSSSSEFIRDKVTYQSYKDRVLEGNISYYRQSVVQQVVTMTGLYSFRKVSGRSRRFSSLSFGAGIARSFLPETYEQTSTGQIEQVSLPGNFFVAPTVAATIGRFKKTKNRASQLRLALSFYVGYNGVTPNISLEYGYKFGKRN